jgi:hypothetical protein
MRHRALLIGVLLPAAFSHVLYGAVTHRGHRDRHGPAHEHFALSHDVRAPRPPHAARPVRMRPMRTGRCDLRDVRVLTAPSSAVGRIAVESGAGELDMEAVPGLDRVEVEATLCGSSRAQLEQLGVTLEPDGDLLRLRTIEPSRARDGYGRVDLTVRVPLGMEATIADARSKR